jgi:hypothetical protein
MLRTKSSLIITLAVFFCLTLSADLHAQLAISSQGNAKKSFSFGDYFALGFILKNTSSSQITYQLYDFVLVDEASGDPVPRKYVKGKDPLFADAWNTETIAANSTIYLNYGQTDLFGLFSDLKEGHQYSFVLKVKNYGNGSIVASQVSKFKYAEVSSGTKAKWENMITNYYQVGLLKKYLDDFPNTPFKDFILIDVIERRNFDQFGGKQQFFRDYINGVDHLLTKNLFLEHVSKVKDQGFLDQVLQSLADDKEGSAILISKAKQKHGFTSLKNYAN